MKLNGTIRTLYAFHQARHRLMRHDTRAALLKAQRQKLDAFLSGTAAEVRAFKAFRGRSLEDWPVMDKASLMADFAAYNQLGLSTEDAWTHFEAGTAPSGHAIGASTGTSGNRGLYIVSEAERYQWLGTILAHALPDFLTRRHRVAVVLPANSRLYDAANESGRLTLRFFDLSTGIEAQFAPISSFQPTVIVAPPKLLRALAEAAPDIHPDRIFSSAEVLDDTDRTAIETQFGVGVREIYMATEGLFAIACEHQTLHMMEDQVAFEFMPVDGSATLVTPLITDFSRKTQIMVRYSMNDILELGTEPCQCGRPHISIKQVHGRCDDIFELTGARGGTVRITPDVIRNAVLGSNRSITDFRVVQTGPASVRLELAKAEATCLPAGVMALKDLFRRCAASAQIEPVAMDLTPPSDHKLRRVMRLSTGEPA